MWAFGYLAVCRLLELTVLLDCFDAAKEIELLAPAGYFPGQPAVRWRQGSWPPRSVNFAPTLL